MRTKTISKERRDKGVANLTHGKQVHYTKEERHKQEQAVEQLLMGGYTDSVIARMVSTQFGIPTRRVHDKLLPHVRDRWAREMESSRATWKSAQIRRIQRNLRNASGRQKEDGSWAVPPNHAAMHKWETLLADITGTREAIKLDVNVEYTSAMMNVIGSMSGEELQEMLDAAERRHALASAYEREHPLLPEVIEHVNGKVVS